MKTHQISGRQICPGLSGPDDPGLASRLQLCLTSRVAFPVKWKTEWADRQIPPRGGGEMVSDCLLSKGKKLGRLFLGYLSSIPISSHGLLQPIPSFVARGLSVSACCSRACAAVRSGSCLDDLLELVHQGIDGGTTWSPPYSGSGGDHEGPGDGTKQSFQGFGLSLPTKMKARNLVTTFKVSKDASPMEWWSG